MKHYSPSLLILIASISFMHAGTVVAQSAAGAPQANCAANGSAPCKRVSPMLLQANPAVMSTAQAQLNVSGYYNVHAFGAQGIGTDDETEAVQTAINTACQQSPDHPHGGIALYFPAGIYPVHGIEVPCGDLVLEGAGAGATQLEYDGQQNSGSYPATPLSSAFVVKFALWMGDGGLRDMTIVGCTSRRPVSGVATDLLVVSGELDSQAVFQNLQFAQAIHDGIHLITPAPAFSAATMGGSHGYTTANGVPVAGGSGSGMMVNIISNGGRVTDVKIFDQGEGYEIGDRLTINEPGSGNDASFVLGARSIYVNWFLRQIRWDGIGRYCIHMDGMVPSSGQPFALYGFTWANPPSGPAVPWLATHGYMPGPNTPGTTPWSQGLIGFTGGSAYLAAIYDGRLEGSDPQIPAGPGQEGNLFVNEMPQQPEIRLRMAGNTISSVEITKGGFGWTPDRVSGVFHGCTKNPTINWTVSNGVLVGATVTNGGMCSADAGVTFYPSGGNLFTAENIVGFICPHYEVPLIFSATGQDGFKLDNVQIVGAMGDFMNGRTGGLSIAGYLTSSDRLAYGPLQAGWSTQGHSFLSTTQKGVTQQGQSVRAGDILFHDASDYQQRPFGQIGAYQIVTYPTHGYTMLRASTNLCGGNLTPRGNVWSGCTPEQLRHAQISAGAALTFPSGAGGSLDTDVTAVDWSTGAITTETAGTAASTVNYTAPQLRDSWTSAASYPTAPDTIYYQGEVIYNAAPAPGKPIWWTCMTKTCTGGAGWLDGPAYGAEHMK